MAVKVSDYPSVRRRLEEIGCPGSPLLSVLPANFETAESPSEFRHLPEAATVKTVMRTSGLPYSDLVGPANRPAYLVNQSNDWAFPLLFVAWSASQDPVVFSAVLDTVARELLGRMPRLGRRRDVKLDVVVETGDEGTCKRVSYSGPPDGIQEIRELVGTMSDE